MKSSSPIIQVSVLIRDDPVQSANRHTALAWAQYRTAPDRCEGHKCGTDVTTTDNTIRLV